MMNYIEHLASTYASLLFIMNPFGALPIYLEIAEKLHPWERRRLANTVALFVLSLLLVFTFAGELILELYKINIDEFRFAGGLILLAIGVMRLTGEPMTQTVDPRDAALVPLSMPLLVGPATITYIIVLAHTIPYVVLIPAIIAVVATVWIPLELGELLLRVAGRSTMRLLTRLTALFVAGIGAGMLHDALLAWG